MYTRGWGTCPGLGCTQGAGAHAQVWGVHKGLGHIPRLEVYMQVHAVNEDPDVPERWGQQLYMLAWGVQAYGVHKSRGWRVHGQAGGVHVGWAVWTGWRCTCRLGHTDRLEVYM